MVAKNIVPSVFHFFPKYGGKKDIAKLLKMWLWRRKRLHSNPRKVKNKSEKIPQTFNFVSHVTTELFAFGGRGE
jgi:hypothetical protein